VWLIHDERKALAPELDATTSVSAPALVAFMLQLLELEPGMRVLEVGAGSGYNAALLAELGCDVTTVEIDPTLIQPARDRLSSLGYHGVLVLEGDGDLGVPDAAPFERIIATVGCNDLSPSWFDQLVRDGFMIVPLWNGSSHPLVRAFADGRRAVVGQSGFVRILGRQADT
jgi:protein-L-isoaspartate(D-aspartate) O-methyltransferase